MPRSRTGCLASANSDSGSRVLLPRTEIKHIRSANRFSCVNPFGETEAACENGILEVCTTPDYFSFLRQCVCVIGYWPSEIYPNLLKPQPNDHNEVTDKWASRLSIPRLPKWLMPGLRARMSNCPPFWMPFVFCLVFCHSWFSECDVFLILPSLFFLLSLLSPGFASGLNASPGVENSVLVLHTICSRYPNLTDPT